MPRHFLASLLGRLALPEDRRPPAALLVLVVALNAAGAMIVEITAGRLLAPYFGASLHTWTTVIGVVLAGLAVGHWAGGWLADAFSRSRTALLALACLAGAASTVLVLPLVRLAAGLVDAAGVSPSAGVVLTGLAAFFVPSIAAGLVQPLATTLALATLGSAAGQIVGRMLAAGVVGAILGTFLAGFVLIAQIGSAGSIWLVAGLNALLAALLLGGGRLRAASAAVAVLGPAMAVWGAALPGFGVPCQAESAYYCINVHPGARVRLPGARLLQLDALAQSVNYADPERLAFSHLALIDAMVRQRLGDRPFTSFFIGGGGYTLPRRWLHRDPGHAVTVAEIDPLVTGIAEASMWLRRTPSTRILDADARVALRRDLMGERFDVIVGDAFGDIAMPAHLVTAEFHALVRDRLAAGGFYALNVIDRVATKRLVRSIAATLERHFGVVEIWVEQAEADGGLWANFVVYAGSRPSGLDAPLASRTMPEWRFERVAPAPGSPAAPALALTDDFAPVEHLLFADWRSAQR